MHAMAGILWAVPAMQSSMWELWGLEIILVLLQLPRLLLLIVWVSSSIHEKTCCVSININVDGNSGADSNAIVGQFFGSTITVYGGNFIGSQESNASNGHSLHVSFNTQSNVHVGDFHRTCITCDWGVIVAHGFFSKSWKSFGRDIGRRFMFGFAGGWKWWK